MILDGCPPGRRRGVPSGAVVHVDQSVKEVGCLRQLKSSGEEQASPSAVARLPQHILRAEEASHKLEVVAILARRVHQPDEGLMAGPKRRGSEVADLARG